MSRYTCVMPIPRALNQDFFKKWSREMAYVLGFFAADGNMIQNRRGGHFIAFYSCDRILLSHVRTAMGSGHTIGKRPNKNPDKWQTAFQLQIGSRRMFSDLLRLGLTPAKSKTLMLPRIPRRFHGDFVRGYFDGDGCIYFKRIKFADRKYPRNIIQSLFTSGSRKFLNDLHTMLKTHGVTGGSFKTKQRNSGFEILLSFRDSLALYKLMYNNALDTGLYLPRKYKLFQRAIRTLYPNLRV